MIAAIHCSGPEVDPNATIPVAVFLISTALFAADNPFLGTWKLNRAKSKASPGPIEQSMTVKFEADGAKVRRTVTGIDRKGKSPSCKAAPRARVSLGMEKIIQSRSQAAQR